MPKHFLQRLSFSTEGYRAGKEGRKNSSCGGERAGKDFPLVELESLQVLIGMHLDEIDSLRGGIVQETGGDRLQD